MSGDTCLGGCLAQSIRILVPQLGEEEEEEELLRIYPLVKRMVS